MGSLAARSLLSPLAVRGALRRAGCHAGPNLDPQPPEDFLLSHIVTVQTKIQDPAAIAAACRRLGLPQAVQGTAQLYSGEATGLLVQLPGWHYPVVLDPATGRVRYDNYEGAWGAQEHLDRFVQAYAIERVRLEARKSGYQVVEQPLQDGSVKLQLVEGS
jgi:hypothetical protein